jgi:imidazolonepropionase-like amidohydrolase
MSRGEVLTRATLDMARYVGREKDLGSIVPGKLADFFLVPGNPLDELKVTKRAAMVVKNGVVYFPAEIYPNLGIRPLAAKPAVTVPEGVAF